ncbi:MAG: hypothetical protein M3250_05855 [Thermoproteota archaeon]|nr:hypothetical protein [Thermoproteota archaeon]
MGDEANFKGYHLLPSVDQNMLPSILYSLILLRSWVSDSSAMPKKPHVCVEINWN